jgi:hypothetical protein
MKWKTFCYRLRSIAAYFCTLLFVVPGIAQAQTPGDIAWAELLHGRAVALIRHTVAPAFKQNGRTSWVCVIRVKIIPQE